jgi:hypothetical protein
MVVRIIDYQINPIIVFFVIKFSIAHFSTTHFHGVFINSKLRELQGLLGIEVIPSYLIDFIEQQKQELYGEGHVW